MIKQIKRTEPKSHSWPAKIFYKHQQATGNKAVTNEILPRTQLAGSCISPEVLKFSIFRSQVPFLAAMRKGPVSKRAYHFSCRLLQSSPLPHPVFQGTTQLCLLGNQVQPSRLLYKHQRAIKDEAFTDEVSASQSPSLSISFHTWKKIKWESWTRRHVRFLVLYFQVGGDRSGSLCHVYRGVSSGYLPKDDSSGVRMKGQTQLGGIKWGLGEMGLERAWKYQEGQEVKDKAASQVVHPVKELVGFRAVLPWHASCLLAQLEARKTLIETLALPLFAVQSDATYFISPTFIFLIYKMGLIMTISQNYWDQKMRH